MKEVYVKLYKVCPNCKGTKEYLNKKFLGQSYIESVEKCRDCDDAGMVECLDGDMKPIYKKVV